MKYYSVAHENEAELVIKKSRFIAKICPVSVEAEARAKLEEIRSLHRDATHNVYAYRLGQAERFSDDGEPSGTAGKPILEVLRRENLDHVLVVVTRYFGGILLGAGGLVRAYAQAAKAAVNQAGKVCLVQYRQMTVSMDYAFVNRVNYEAELNGFIRGATEYTHEVSTVFLVLEQDLERFISLMSEISSGMARVEVGEKIYRAEPVA